MEKIKPTIEDYKTLIKLLRRHLLEKAFIGEELYVLKTVCESCYESALQARELLNEIDKILS